MLRAPFYDPTKTYYENWEEGPFAGFADGEILAAGTPRFEFLGTKLAYPLGIPASPPLNGKYVEAALDKGFDVPVYKTVRSREYPCHPWPNVLGADIDGELTLDRAKEPIVVRNVYKEPLSITNSFGVPSYPPEVWQGDLTEAIRSTEDGQLVIGSFEGTKWEGTSAEEYIADWASVAEMVAHCGTK